MKLPRQWTVEEFRKDASAAKDIFRNERTDEPLERYSEFFDAFTPIFGELIDELDAIRDSDGAEPLAQLMRNTNKKTAFRYLTAPPISEDDLKVLAYAKLSAKALRADPDSAKRVRDIVLHILDPHRFPWVQEGRQPSETEREIAIVSSAALVAAKKVETERRGKARSEQELAVKNLLIGLGYSQVPKRSMPLLEDAPALNEFCDESNLGGTRADLVVKLHDRRVMPI